MNKFIKFLSMAAVAVCATSTAFAAAQVDPDPSVPDGGATVGLLAIAVVGLVGFAAKRRAK